MTRLLPLVVATLIVLTLANAAIGLRAGAPALGGGPPQVLAAPGMPAGGDEPIAAMPVAQGVNVMVQSYAAKFVCLEPLPAGTLYYGAAAPLVKMATDVLIHNPNAFPITVYKKAVIAPLDGVPEAAPGGWKKVEIKPDYAWRIDCDEIARLISGIPTATFVSTYGIGVRVEGFVVVGMGPQTVAGSTGIRYASLDVTAEYERSSEVMKKDINYTPWWTYWWWNLPWRLGYSYERLIPISPTGNIDCRGLLYQALSNDANTITNTQERNHTLAALNLGAQIGPTRQPKADDDPALVALMGGCHKLDATMASVDYILVSNVTQTDPNPMGGSNLAVQRRYPWIPGRWYDLPVVMPQNRTIDLDDYLRQWNIQRWTDKADGLSSATISAAMVYYFPWWCGWGYWWWWWSGGSCTDIGVGEGESLDVEQVTPTRVFLQWPPTTS
ncbi:MAG: hypothetical protein U0556_07555 [Dehalococcoidia bacterium]